MPATTETLSSNPEGLLRLHVAAARLAVSERTVRRLALSDPTFPPLLRVGSRSRRVRDADLSRWIAARQASPTHTQQPEKTKPPV